MPNWITTTEGGSWNGGGTEVMNCNLTQRNMITAAFNTFIADSCLDCFPGLEDCLRDKWDNVDIDCEDSQCVANNWDGYRSGNKIVICQNGFDAGQNRINALVLHEMVHLCDGTELDAEAVENACFRGGGATNPSTGDWVKFFDETSAWEDNEEVRKGKWVIWDSTTGEVWGIDKEGGSWNSGPEEVRGSRCFQNSTWIRTDPDPDSGGWT